jgi:hypothetical protein
MKLNIPFKECIKCNEEKEPHEFVKSSRSKDGYENVCLLCRKQYNILNKNRDKEVHKIYYQNNKEKIYKGVLKCREDNNEFYIEQRKQYRKERYKNDSLYKLRCIINAGIYQSFKKNKFKKKNKSLDILGCNIKFFKDYLENKFESWMNWDNQNLYNGELNYGWDIDHIIPLSNAKTEEELLKLLHYTNLQPLCSKVNRDIKKDKLKWKVEDLEIL